jgi:hypothetical protein
MENTKEKDEISLKELLLKGKEWFAYLFSKKIRIISVALVGALLGFGYAKFIAKPMYTSKITFTMEQKGSSGGLGEIASMVGLGDLASGGGGSSGMFGGENILFLMKSDRIIHEALKMPNEQLQGDHLLNEYVRIHYKSALKEKEINLFPKVLDSVVFSRAQDSLLQVVTKQIRENQLVAERLDKKTSIINLAVTDENEQWAFLFSQLLIQHAIELYMDIKLGKLLDTETTLVNKRDSIRGLLDGSITTLAFETDLNSHTPLMRYKTNQAKKQIDVQMLTAMYGDIVKNLEITRFTKSQEEPIIEIIDEPILPLDKVQFGKLKGIVVGGFLAAFLMIGVLIGRKVLKKIMN